MLGCGVGGVPSGSLDALPQGGLLCGTSTVVRMVLSQRHSEWGSSFLGVQPFHLSQIWSSSGSPAPRSSAQMLGNGLGRLRHSLKPEKTRCTAVFSQANIVAVGLAASLAQMLGNDSWRSPRFVRPSQMRPCLSLWAAHLGSGRSGRKAGGFPLSELLTNPLRFQQEGV